MKYETLAFFNQQLGTMLRQGIPLEGALQQLCANMQRGELRGEMEQLAADLKAGTPLDNALAVRKLPPFYVQMVRVGVRSNDLPGMLLMLADYYRQVDLVWTRLKGLMVYPLLVLVAAFGVSCLFTYFFSKFGHVGGENGFLVQLSGAPFPPAFLVSVWVPPVVLGTVLLLAIIALATPSLNRRLLWRLPAFKEAKLAQFASAMQLMLKSGGELSDALALAGQLEHGTPAGAEVSHWQERLKAGRGKFAEMAAPSRAFPPLFLWLVGNAGEDLAAGFKRAAEIYTARATYRIEMFLYAALPFAVLGLGMMILFQVLPVLRILAATMNSLGSAD